MTAAAARAFDAVAETYDTRFTESRVGIAQRRAVWRLLDRVFPPGAHVLEINCGTGADAAHLAARGVRVHACDVSAGMLQVARRRLRRIHGTVLEQRSTEDLAGVAGPYDGLLSNFGGINCIEGLPSALAQVKRLVRLGGDVILCYMGPVCAWEMVWFLAHGRLRKACRRWKRSAVTGSCGDEQQFPVQYPTVGAIIRALAPECRLAKKVGVGVFVPPSYAEAFAADHRRALEFAIRLDSACAGLPVFRAVGDHVLLHFKKVCQ